MNIAIIPARAGSKRIKNKNIRIFKGKPMIAWTIIAAKKSKIFDHILVSTDSKKISKIAIKYGAEVPFLRSKKLANNKASIHKATLEALLMFENKKNIRFKNIVQLMPNCPLKNYKDKKKFFNYFIKNKLNFLISSASSPFLNPWWSFIQKKGRVKKLFPVAYKKRSQDLDEILMPTGAIWVANRDKFLIEKSFYNKKTKFLKINWKSAADIDTLIDFKIAESLS